MVTSLYPVITLMTKLTSTMGINIPRLKVNSLFNSLNNFLNNKLPLQSLLLFKSHLKNLLDKSSQSLQRSL